MQREMQIAEKGLAAAPVLKHRAGQGVFLPDRFRPPRCAQYCLIQRGTPDKGTFSGQGRMEPVSGTNPVKPAHAL
ncbi:Uncharacterised protein [Klebsiella pneumoniae]|nr:Uncharacterised protein [Klebsiella pneumoniae]